MRLRLTGLLGVVALGASGFVALSLTRGQDRPKPQAVDTAALAKEIERPGRHISQLTPLQRQMDLSAQRGADWLCRANRSDGRFVYGYLPALKTVLEGDHYLRQVGAAVALAREGCYTGNERHTAVARQAVLTLLLDTSIDLQDKTIRYTTLPSAVVNRVAAAGLLVLAINELPKPGEDLLEQSEQLCVFIAQQQRPDGSLNFSDGPTDPKPSGGDDDGINYYPGEAMYGLMVSQRHRPAAWKTEVVRRARNYYLTWWRTHQNMALVPWHVAAYTEAYLLTRKTAFAEAVNEMTDWLLGLQYVHLDPRHPFWGGGFMGWADGKAVPAEPQVNSASYAEGLVEACRVARQAGDLTRYQHYRAALENCLQFLTTLQYTDANTQHFSDWYRPVLLGGFHASHQDGNLRIDYTQHGVCALVQYLTNVAQ